MSLSKTFQMHLVKRFSFVQKKIFIFIINFSVLKTVVFNSPSKTFDSGKEDFILNYKSVCIKRT